MHKRTIYKYDLKDARDCARLAPAESPFHDFAPLKEYPFCPLLVLSVANSNIYQCFLGLDKIVENFELEVV